MLRDSLGSKLKQSPVHAKLLHECRDGHTAGIKPGVLETHLGDYGMRDYLRQRYDVLDLSVEGLCPACSLIPRSD